MTTSNKLSTLPPETWGEFELIELSEQNLEEWQLTNGGIEGIALALYELDGVSKVYLKKSNYGNCRFKVIGGDVNLIAETLWCNKKMGINFCGDTTITVNYKGFVNRVSFDWEQV